MRKNIYFNNYYIAWIVTLILFLSSCGKKNDVVPAPAKSSVDSSINVVPVKPVASKELGWGCDITKGYPSSACVTFRVINIDALNALSNDRVVLTQMSGNNAFVIAAEDLSRFSKAVSAKLTVSAAFGLFKSSASFFDSTAMRSDVIIATYNSQIFKDRLRLNASLDLLRKNLTPEFKADIATQTPAYIVSHYGTSLLVDIVRGGSLNVAYRARTSSTDRKSAASAGLSVAMKNIFDISVSPGVNAALSQTNTDQYLDYKTSGGNSSIALVGELTLGSTVPDKIQIAQWQGSITSENAELIDAGSQDGLIDLSELVSDPAKAAALKSYIHKYLLAHQVKMIDPPPVVYQYVDGVNGDYAYSVENLPALFGRFFQPAPVFRAYASKLEKSVPVYQYYSASNADLILTTNAKFTSGDYTPLGIVFYAYTTQVPGTVPIFEYLFSAKIHKNIYYSHYYSTSRQLPAAKDWAYTGLPFYAFPL
jgi:hypothetical protein